MVSLYWWGGGVASLYCFGVSGLILLLRWSGITLLVGGMSGITLLLEVSGITTVSGEWHHSTVGGGVITLLLGGSGISLLVGVSGITTVRGQWHHSTVGSEWSVIALLLEDSGVTPVSYTHLTLPTKLSV